MREKKYAYEHGARKYPARAGSDPSDEFSQDAAGNKPPVDGAGLTRKVAKKKKPGSPDKNNKETPPPRDVREAPAPNPNGRPIEPGAKIPPS